MLIILREEVLEDIFSYPLGHGLGGVQEAAVVLLVGDLVHEFLILLVILEELDLVRFVVIQNSHPLRWFHQVFLLDGYGR